MPRQTYRKKRSRKQRQKRSRTRCNTRRHRGGDYTNATIKELGGYAYDPKKTVIVGADGIARTPEEHKAHREHVDRNGPEY